MINMSSRKYVDGDLGPDTSGKVYGGLGKILVVTPEHENDCFRDIVRGRVCAVYDGMASRVHIVTRGDLGSVRYGEFGEIVYTTSPVGKEPEKDREVLAGLKHGNISVVPFEKSIEAIGEALKRASGEPTDSA
jgi:hypothetical protein